MNEKAEITADMVKNLSILLMEKDKDDNERSSFHCFPI